MWYYRALIVVLVLILQTDEVDDYDVAADVDFEPQLTLSQYNLHTMLFRVRALGQSTTNRLLLIGW